MVPEDWWEESNSLLSYGTYEPCQPPWHYSPKGEAMAQHLGGTQQLSNWSYDPHSVKGTPIQLSGTRDVMDLGEEHTTTTSLNQHNPQLHSKYVSPLWLYTMWSGTCRPRNCPLVDTAALRGNWSCCGSHCGLSAAHFSRINFCQRAVHKEHQLSQW